MKIQVDAIDVVFSVKSEYLYGHTKDGTVGPVERMNGRYYEHR